MPATIAILGATSQIARDLTARLAATGEADLALFSRDPAAVAQWAATLKPPAKISSDGYEGFARGIYAAVINFVGVGNPARLAQMGAEIFEVTTSYDEMALAYLSRWPACKYIFLSSGAAYGGSFTTPATAETITQFAINTLTAQDFYGIAKFHAEARHRALADRAIVDIRVFSYFSRSQDLSARFLMSDIVRAIRSGETMATNAQSIIRDYLHPDDFHSLVRCLLTGPRSNIAIDCYSRAPVDKTTLLKDMAGRFGLKYEIGNPAKTVTTTGTKPHYYSLNRRAAEFGYVPKFTSIDGITVEVTAILDEARIR